MTTGYNAGLDTSDARIAYRKEVTWGVVDAGQFKYLRMLSEGFQSTRSRTRPKEIKPDGQASHALTTQIQAEGSLGFGVSAGTYDDLLISLLNAVASGSNFGGAAITVGVAPGTVVNLAADDNTPGITGVNTTGPGFTRASGDFVAAGFVRGQWIRTSGFTNAANNGYFRIIDFSPSGNSIIVDGAGSAAIVTEGSAADRRIYNGGMIRNGAAVTTFTIEKALAADKFLRYYGAYPTGGQLQAQLGGFFEGSANFVAKNEDKGTTTLSTGAIIAAPSGRIIDTVTDIGGVSIDGKLAEDPTGADAIVQAINVSFNKENAGLQFGIGSPAARGMRRGTFTLDGSISIYFKNFTVYDMYTAEADKVVSFRAIDKDGAGYIITLPAATIMNPSIVAGGPNADFVAEYELEGNPTLPPYGVAGTDAEYTLQIDKF